LVFINFLFTGHPSWGIAWYLNDLLIPEVYVERGQSYGFQVEGGKLKKKLQNQKNSTKIKLTQ